MELQKNGISSPKDMQITHIIKTVHILYFSLLTLALKSTRQRTEHKIPSDLHLQTASSALHQTEQMGLISRNQQLAEVPNFSWRHRLSQNYPKET